MFNIFFIIWFLLIALSNKESKFPYTKINRTFILDSFFLYLVIFGLYMIQRIFYAI